MLKNLADAALLSNGVQMPWLGLGTWQSAEGNEVEQAVRWALELGYRHIDTAAAYHNEKGVGTAIRDSGIPREQVFVTTKLWNDDHRAGYDAALKAFDASLQKLGMDYVDLYLVHWPVKGKYKEAWRALETIYASKRARAIGVSNFMLHHLKDLLPDAKVRPMVNQVEWHPRLLRRDLLEFCKANAIQFESWSPLIRGKIGQILEVTEIAAKQGKTPAQIVLRWNLQHGVVTIPKSVKKNRLEENAAIFDFELTPEEMNRLDALDQNERIGPDPDNFNF